MNICIKNENRLRSVTRKSEAALFGNTLRWAAMLMAVTVSAHARNCSTSKEFDLRRSQVLAGALEDPSGAVLSGIELELLSSKKVVRHLRTDDLGRYDFGLIPSGKYRIRVRYGDNAFCAPKVQCGNNGCNIEPKVAVNPKSAVMVD
jgi:hypothetical protein